MIDTELDYRVDLDVFNGPLDLLLHLIKKEEIEITEVSIARIADQFLDYMKIVPHLSMDGVGEFLVLAATLMVIKSRALLPVEERPELEEEEDEAAELVRQLLEYRKVKEVARLLELRARERESLYPRAPIAPPDEERLLRVELWDLVEAFAKLVAEVGLDRAWQVVDEDVPVGRLIHEVTARVRAGPVRFRELFPDLTNRSLVLGYFLAVLEMVKDGRLFATQSEPFGEIVLRWREPPLLLLLPPAGGTTGAPRFEEPAPVSGV
jgi:segregation and condensation protein A